MCHLNMNHGSMVAEEAAEEQNAAVLARLKASLTETRRLFELK